MTIEPPWPSKNPGETPPTNPQVSARMTGTQDSACIYISSKKKKSIWLNIYGTLKLKIMIYVTDRNIRAQAAWRQRGAKKWRFKTNNGSGFSTERCTFSMAEVRKWVPWRNAVTHLRGLDEKVGCFDALLNLLELAFRPRQLNEKGHWLFSEDGIGGHTNFWIHCKTCNSKEASLGVGTC